MCAAQDYDLLQVFECSTYFSIKDDNLNLQAKMFVFLDVKSNMKGCKLLDPENKKIVLSKHVTVDT